MRKLGNYIIGTNEIAKGAFSKIFIGYHKHTKNKVAIKEILISNKKNSKKYIKREIEIHKKLNHINIVKLYDVIYESSKIYLILEYCQHGSLSNFQNKRAMNEIYIQNFIYQLAQALKYLRDMKISHRDLKPQNLLVYDYTTIKLSDFGLSKQYNEFNMDNDLKQTYCGSPMYMSPELLNSNSYDTKSDLWSIGVIIYEMITGTLPYRVKNLKQLIRISKTPIVLPDKFKDNISSDCLDLLSKLLDVDSKSRISWDNFFNHQWLKTNHLNDYENNLITSPLNYKLNKPPIFTIENSITDVLDNNTYNRIYKKVENMEDEEDNEDLFLSASSLLGSIEFNATNLDSTNLDSTNLDSTNLKSDSQNSDNNNSQSSNNSTKLEKSYIVINNIKFTDSLESSTNRQNKEKSQIESTKSNIVNIYTKSKPINIKNNRNRNNIYDFHNEENLVDINIPSQSYNSLDSNHSKNMKDFIKNSMEILKQSYKYISNNNNSI